MTISEATWLVDFEKHLWVFFASTASPAIFLEFCVRFCSKPRDTQGFTAQCIQLLIVTKVTEPFFWISRFGKIAPTWDIVEVFLG